MGSLSLVKSGKLYHTFRFPPVFGSCNSKMLLVKSWDNMDPFWKIWFAFIKVTREFLFFWQFFHRILYATFFLIIAWRQNYEIWWISQWKNFFISCFFQIGLIETWNKKYFSSLITDEKKLFYSISGAMHSNNISEILILFQYFRNMDPCHRRFKYILNTNVLIIYF